MSPEAIETTLSQQAQLAEVSVAKLRAVYIRGIKEAVATGYSGPLHNYGLVRVHRFLSAMSNNNPRLTQDHDFLPRMTNAPQTPNVQIEYSEDDFKTFQLVSAILSGDISQAIPEAEDIHFDSGTKELIISARDWSARIDLKSEEFSIFSKK